MAASKYYPSQPSLLDLGPIPGSVARVFEYFKNLPRKLSECWRAAKTIAAELGISERTVQEAIKRLVELGYVAYRTDYGLKTRRAIVMLWRVESKSSESVSQPSESQTKPSEHDHVLHRPERLESEVARAADAPEAPIERVSETPQAATVGVVEGPEVTSTRKATADEVAKLIDDARRLRGGEPSLIKRLAREHGLSTVQACVKYALANGKKSVGWLFKALPDWSKNGVPEYAQIKEPKYTPEEARRIMHAEAEKMLASLTPLTDAEILAHEKFLIEHNAWLFDKMAGHLKELENVVV